MTFDMTVDKAMRVLRVGTFATRNEIERAYKKYRAAIPTQQAAGVYNAQVLELDTARDVLMETYNTDMPTGKTEKEAYRQFASKAATRFEYRIENARLCKNMSLYASWIALGMGVGAALSIAKVEDPGTKGVLVYGLLFGWVAAVLSAYTTALGAKGNLDEAREERKTFKIHRDFYNARMKKER